MTIGTLLRFLVGNRAAIETVAGHRHALAIGALFVLSAGLARDYDGADLLAEPYWLLLPFAASVAMAMALFLVMRFIVGFGSSEAPPFWRAYSSVLAAFWMTAPLAWLYAIPYERFLSPVDAAVVNLWTLGIVAVWRVLLISRAFQVIGGVNGLVSFAITALLADAVLLAAMAVSPLPVIDFMGGARLNPTDQLLVNVRLLVTMLGVLGLAAFGLTSLIGLVVHKAQWPALPERSGGSRGLWRLGVASVLVWAPILPLTQTQQRLAGQVERLMRESRVPEAIRLLSAHRPDEFPPAWDPPPRVGYNDEGANLLDVMQHLARGPASTWVRANYIDKFEREYVDNRFPRKDRWAAVEEILAALPEGPEIAVRYRERIDHMRQSAGDAVVQPVSPAKPPSTAENFD